MVSVQELVSALKGWCRGEVVEEAQAVMVLIQEDVDTNAIEETMQTVKCLGGKSEAEFSTANKTDTWSCVNVRNE